MSSVTSTIKETLKLSHAKKSVKNGIRKSSFLNSYQGRKIVKGALNFTHWMAEARRHRLGEGIIGQGTMPKIPKDKGFVIWPAMFDPVVQQVVEDSQKIFAEYEPQLETMSSKKSYLIEIPIESYIRPGSSFLELALHPQILSTVADYLGTLPILREIRMRYSPNSDEVGGSQFYHVDKEDTRMVKVFLYVTNATPEAGPLTAVSSDTSERMMVKRGRFHPVGRETDEFVEGNVGDDDTAMIVGEPGTLAFLDVARCFHYGSRPSPESRLLAWFVYHSAVGLRFPFSLMASPRDDFRSMVNQNSSEIEKLVLT